MIETKEQYQWIEQWSCDHDMSLSDEEKQDVYETIEALREVARAAKNVSQATEYSDNHWRVHHHDMGPMRIFLEALPDWIKEDG